MRSFVVDRRSLLQAVVGVAGVSFAGSKAMAAACVAPNGPDASLRQSLHYAEASPNPAQHCSGCAFFAEPKGDCGKCMIFNGPANPNGHCDSWAAKS